MVEQTLQGSAVGTPDMVKQAVDRFIERTGADELIITGSIFDQVAREKSYTIAANIRELIAA
jgi:alkanesulfonate monooxygenase SsuD/methylene tetrahydromethanopterin reductase-like flavin-dependent oxidoreductase (luciferase family)